MNVIVVIFRGRRCGKLKDEEGHAEYCREEICPQKGPVDFSMSDGRNRHEPHQDDAVYKN
jgi:hypothetical protein